MTAGTAWLSPLEVVLLVLLSGWAAADTTAAFQLMVGQPLVAGALAGLIVGEPVAGLMMGAALQLLWSRLAPVGAQAFPDVGPATVCGVAVAALLGASPLDWTDGARVLGPQSGTAVLPLLAGLLVALAAGRLGQVLTVLLRRDNARLARAADRAAERGSFAGVERENALGVLRSYLRGVALFLIVVPTFLGVAWIVAGRRGQAAAASGTNLGFLLFWWFGVAAVLSVLWRGGRRDWGLVAGGLVVGLVLSRFL